MAMLAWAGDADAGERALAPFRALAEPLADMVRPMPYAEHVPARRSGLPPGRGRPHGVRRRDVDAAARRRAAIGADAPCAVVQLRVLGGAMARVPADATAFAHRERRMMGNVVAMYERPRRARRGRGVGRRARRADLRR